MHNILNFQFFKINLENNYSEDAFNYLFSFLNSSRNYRLATNEIILYNIQLFIQIFMKKNNENLEIKKKFGNKLLNLFNKQVNQMNELIENHIEINKDIFDSCLKAYDYYVKNLEKKMIDLFIHCKISRDNNFILCQAIFSADTLYYGEVMSGRFDDLSKVKIFKKIPMRYLDFKNGDNECTLNVYDKSSPATATKSIIMHCINKSNTKTMFNYMLQLKISCNGLERSLFDSLIEEIKSKLNKLISE
jgi:hypothetical protein